MTNSEQPQQLEIEEPEHNNIKLIYEHIEYQIALINRSIDISSAKLGFTLGLTMGLIIFQTATHPTNNHFLFFDVLVVILSLVGFGFCLAGFQSKSGGVLMLAKALYDEHYYDTEETFYFTLTSVALESIESLSLLRDFRAKMAKRAIWFFCAAISCKAIGWLGFELASYLVK
jgi:hypothetical protein